MSPITLKNNLIKYKPGPNSTPAIYAPDFISLQKELTTTNISKDTVLILDTLSLWFSRISGYVKSQGWSDLECLGNVTRNDLICLMISLFQYLCDFHSGNGPLASAGSMLLQRLLKFVNLVQGNKSATATNLLPMDFLEIPQKLINMSLQIPSSHKSFYYISSALFNELQGSADILNEVCSTDLFTSKCLAAMEHTALANVSSRAFSSFFTSLNNPKTHPELFIQAWSPCVSKALLCPIRRKNVADHLLPCLFKEIPQCFEDWCMSLPVAVSGEKRLLTILPILKSASQFCPATHWQLLTTQIISHTDLQQALTHSNERLRLDSFTLVCSSISATSGGLDFSLDILADKSVLDIFFTECSTPDERTTFIFTFRKALSNLRDFMNKQMKKDSNSAVLKKPLASLSLIFNSVCSYLSPDSNYGQIVICTLLLETFIELGFDGINRTKKSNLTLFNFFPIFTPDLTLVLLKFTTNNYEDIRSRCSEILESCPFEVFQQIYSDNTFKESLPLLRSCKGRQSDSAAQLVSTVFRIHEKSESLHCIDILDLLLHGMDETLAVSASPHGFFTAFSAIFQTLTPKILRNHQEYFQTIFDHLLQTIFALWKVNKPFLVQAPTQLDEDVGPHSWRVIKESSSLISTLITLNEAHQWQYFNAEMFGTICVMLMEQLSGITHRGAFSAISPTFIKACDVCFRTQILKENPEKWLKENLDLLKTKEQFISRRSAGIPFLFTAILISSTHLGQIAEFLDLAVGELLKIAKMPYKLTHDEKNDIPQVHAFNCLKFIVRESKLSSHVHKYTQDVLTVSLNNLNHPTWAIKNGAVMLFTAVQERIFGSHSLGGGFPSVNATLFFSKYPGISDMFLEKLTTSTVKESVNEILPVLTILSRLRTFSDEDTSVHLFISLLRTHFLGHRMWKIREIAARLLCNLLDEKSKKIEFSNLLPFQNYLKNSVHGRWMCAREIIQILRAGELDSSFEISILDNFHLMMSHSKLIGWINFRAYMALFDQTSVPGIVVDKIAEVVLSELSNPPGPLDGAKNLFLESMTSLLLKNSPLERRISLSKVFFVSHAVEVQLAAAKFWSDHITEFERSEELRKLVLGAINDPQVWNHVKCEYLKLVAHGTPPPAMNSDGWTDQMKCLFLEVIATEPSIDSDQFNFDFKKFYSDEQPESLRLSAVNAGMSFLKEHSDVGELESSIAFGIFERLSDESCEIREAALGHHSQCPSSIKKLQLNQYLSKYGVNGCKTLMQNVVHTIDMNLRDGLNELQSIDYHIERVNLYRNEVKDHELEIRAILMWLWAIESDRSGKSDRGNEIKVRGVSATGINDARSKRTEDDEADRSDHLRVVEAKVHEIVNGVEVKSVEVIKNRVKDSNINDFEQNFNDSIIQCIKKSLKIFQENQKYLQMWSYNLHFDTAIRKIANFQKMGGEISEQADKLSDFLESLNYR